MIRKGLETSVSNLGSNLKDFLNKKEKEKNDKEINDTKNKNLEQGNETIQLAAELQMKQFKRDKYKIEDCIRKIVSQLYSEPDISKNHIQLYINNQNKFDKLYVFTKANDGTTIDGNLVKPKELFTLNAYEGQIVIVLNIGENSKPNNMDEYNYKGVSKSDHQDEAVPDEVMVIDKRNYDRVVAVYCPTQCESYSELEITVTKHNRAWIERKDKMQIEINNKSDEDIFLF